MEANVSEARAALLDLALGLVHQAQGRALLAVDLGLHSHCWGHRYGCERPDDRCGDCGAFYPLPDDWDAACTASWRTWATGRVSVGGAA